jgi:IclR family pca regulon transcriptional regulator
VTAEGLTDEDHDAGERPGRDPSELGYSRVLVRGLEILACFTREHPMLGVADVADEMKMSRSTVHRYMGTLVALGFLQKDRRNKYRLTLRVTRLGLSTLANTALRDHAHRYLEDLCRDTSFTSSLAVLDGSDVLVLDRLQGSRHRPHQGEVDLDPESRLPMHCTATGKLLLAHLHEAERNRLLRDITLTAETPRTITRKPALREELTRIRAAGMAVNDQELVLGTHAIAVPVRSVSREVVAALGMAAPIAAISLASLVEHLTPHLIVVAGRISARLGYRPQRR